ncbi:MAG: neutral/alkaline non-lysosomal ceramidase N-terminal domain-containing protein [Planctomycetaceae bacterium]
MPTRNAGCARPLFTALIAVLVIAPPVFAADDAHFQFGFAKVDITPTEPVRLSGYSNRDQAYEGIDEPLFVRAMALKSGDSLPCVVVSVDTIGFPGALTREVFEAVEAQHKLPRANLALACTHSHTSPHLGRGLDNLYNKPQSDDERARTVAYTDFVRDRVIQAVGDALAHLAPGRLFTSEGAAHFAANRRVIKNGKWTDFGISPDGPVDHALPILKITDASGQAIRGLIYNYACHCTTFTGDYNRVNGDWAGYSAKYLEQAHPEAVALCTIGCGADANPQRDAKPDRALALAQSQGRELSDEITRLLAGPMREITAPLHATYGFAGLPIDRPSTNDLQEHLNDKSPQVRRHAENMLALRRRMGRIPETCPMPIQVWRFGEQYAMFFLGGEVVAEYSQRIKREFAHDGALGPAWVTAYANDVFGYVASERMRDEGGYEVDFSMIYYNQPGRWSTGTEDVILRRVHELYEDKLPQSPLTPEAALPLFKLPPGLEIGIVAAEPLITDPIHFSVGPDGRLWVVEMGDYPRGAHDDGQPGGSIRVLTDVDHDGRYDEAITFLDGIAFPTGVIPWRKGALISAAPSILYAEDTDGDGRADQQQPLFTGFKEGNPQHRVNGFWLGLDNWLYLAGSESRQVACVRTGAQVELARSDCRIDPDRNKLEPETGRSQFGRTRDDWGHWFGNSNSEPLYGFLWSGRYSGRNPFVPAPSAFVRLYDLNSPPPPVFPTSRTVDRFNDLYTENRYTSACSPHVFRDNSLGEDVYGAVLVCEPVHNLVSRMLLEPQGVSFQWRRHPDEQASEFLSSTDNWFRPTHLETGPDGALWIADMYRLVIEHPQWIPETWQAQLDLYAGHDRGRIYRVYQQPAEQGSRPVFEIPDFTRIDDVQLAAQLNHPNGWRRDTAQLLLVQKTAPLSPDAVAGLEAMARGHESPLAQVHALNVLNGRQVLNAGELRAALETDNPLVAAEAVRVAESRLDEPEILAAVLPLAHHADAKVRLQVALSLGFSNDPQAAEALAEIATQPDEQQWLLTAIASSANGKADALLAALLRRTHGRGPSAELIPRLVATALGDDPLAGVNRLLDTIAPTDAGPVENWQMAALAACLDGLWRHQIDVTRLAASTDSTNIVARTQRLFAAARAAAGDASATLEDRLASAVVLGRGADQQAADRALLAAWLAPQSHADLQSAAIEALARLQTDDVPGLLLEYWPSAAPQLRARILETLLSRSAWTEALVAALADGRLTAADLDAASRRRLTDNSSEKVRTRAAELLGAPTSPDRDKVMASYESVYNLSADPKRGADVFKQRCAACHQHHGIGTNVGAQLSALSNKTADFLVTAVLDPNRAVEYKFVAYNILAKDGRVITGLIADESASSLTIAKSDGTRDTILRTEVEELKVPASPSHARRPRKGPDPADLADVIAFIQSPEPPKP